MHNDFNFCCTVLLNFNFYTLLCNTFRVKICLCKIFPSFLSDTPLVVITITTIIIIIIITPCLKNPKVHHRTRNSPPPVLVLRQSNPIHTSQANLPKIHSDPIFQLSLGLPSGLFPSRFPTKTLYTFLSSPMRVTCPAQLIRLDLTCLMISGDEYKL
jgi:hypothetical protein